MTYLATYLDDIVGTERQEVAAAVVELFGMATKPVDGINFGYGPDGAGLIRLGSNTAFDGLTGAAQVGGAGPKDGGNGGYLVNDGHPNWNVIQSSIAFNPTEWNIYGNGVGGVAESDGSTTLSRVTGSAWGSFMVGRFLWFDGVAYTVISASSSSAELNTAPPAGTACWHYVYTTGSGTCTVAGGIVTRTLGDPFIPHTFTTDTFEFWLNGVAYTVTTSTSGDQCTISSPPANGSYSYSYRTNINNQVATLRLQLTAGGSEENLTHFAAPYAYVSGAQFSGSGKRRSWYLTSEDQAVVEMAPAGKFVTLGGPQGNEAIRALWDANTVNRFDAIGGDTGFGPGLRSRGTDTNIGIAIDMKGAGSLSVTNGEFDGFVFVANRAAGVDDYIELNAGTGTVVIAGKGTSANVSIDLSPKGTGLVNAPANGFGVAGIKVVGAQAAAVADATDAASAITQLNALLARCRAHGLIAT